MTRDDGGAMGREPEDAAPRWPVDGGEMGAAIRALDWEATPLGPPSGWPERLRATVDLILPSSFPAVALWGPDLLQVYNDGYRRIMGPKHPAGLGQPTRECWPEVWHLNAPIYARVWRGESVAREDALYPIARDGGVEDAWFTLAYSPLRDEVGTIAGILVTVVETTARVLAERRHKETEGALRAREEHLRLAVAAARLATFEWDLATDRVTADARVAQLFGLPPGATASGAALLTGGIHPASRAVVEGALRRATDPASDGRFAVEFRAPAPGGDRWIYCAGQVYFAGAGAARQAARIIGTGIDITRRKEAETALRASETRIRLAIEVAELATWEWNLDTDIVRWNDRHFTLFGLTPRAEPLRPHDFFDHVHPGDRDRIAAALDRAIQERVEFIAEFRAVRADGGIRWMAGRGRVTSEEAGRPTQVAGVMSDITDRKRAEADSKRLLEAEREARQLAEDTVRGRDQFLATAAHELRAPLARLRLSSQLLQLGDAFPAAERDETLAAIERASVRLERLVRDLVDLARLRTGQFALVVGPVDLGAMAHEAVDEARARAAADGRRQVALESPADLPIITGDAGRLAQVLANLLDNAAHYSPPRSRITMQLRRAGTGVAITVRDQGQGLAVGEEEAIFAPFARSAQAVSQEQQGLGLGLAICRGIVAQHGGWIQAESAGEGRGTTVTFWLPLAGPPGASADDD